MSRSATIVLDHYTAAWDEAMRPTAPRVGTMVRVPAHTSVDAREWDAFRRALGRAGLDLAYSHATRRSTWSVVVAAEVCS